jgi:hypothetical protein
LQFGRDVAGVERVSLLEEVDADASLRFEAPRTVRLELRPFEVASIRLRLR